MKREILYRGARMGDGKFDYGCFLAYEDDVQVGILAELSTMFIKKIGNIHDNKELLS